MYEFCVSVLIILFQVFKDTEDYLSETFMIMFFTSAAIGTLTCTVVYIGLHFFKLGVTMLIYMLKISVTSTMFCRVLRNLAS